MMKPIAKDKIAPLTPLFASYQWNYLTDAVLEGHHGTAWADDDQTPHVAVLEFPKLHLNVVGGDAGHPAARAYLQDLPPYTALFFAGDGWATLAHDTLGDTLLRISRYAFTSETLDIAHLQALATHKLEGYRVARMTLALTEKLFAEKSCFSEDHIINFDSPADFIARGFGFCMLQADNIVGVASTFTVCNRGVEIQINVREQHQRQGIATLLAATFALYCLKHGLDPNWDAANQTSVGLASKLGYTYQGPYTMFFLND